MKGLELRKCFSEELLHKLVHIKGYYDDGEKADIKGIVTDVLGAELEVLPFNHSQHLRFQLEHFEPATAICLHDGEEQGIEPAMTLQIFTTGEPLEFK